jgi:HK97 gp10 family phage protein
MALSPQLQKFDRLMRKLPEEVAKEIQPTLIRQGNRLVKEMQSRAPVETGALRDSITVTPPGASTPAYSQPGGSRVAAPNEVIVTAGNERVRYAHLPEFGTSKMKAEPYFWPSVRLLQTSIRRSIKRGLSSIASNLWRAQ